MRRAVVVLLAASALVACASGSAGTSPGTSLRITYWENGLGLSQPVRWTLRCSPAGGTLTRPAVACRRLGADGARLLAPVPEGIACTQIYGGPQVARIVGTIGGKWVWATFTRTDGCHIGRWNRLSPWLLPAGGIT